LPAMISYSSVLRFLGLRVALVLQRDMARVLLLRQ
jgi:hypothetical protein